MDTLKEGYYELTISDGRINYNTIVLEDKETGETKTVKIIGSYLPAEGLVEEMISWVKLKPVSKVVTMHDRRVYGMDENNTSVVLQILPEGEYVSYYSEPCFQKAVFIPQQQAFQELNNIKYFPNGVKQYRSLIESLIFASPIHFSAVQNNSEVIEIEMFQEDMENKGDKIDVDGYYRLVLTNGESYYKSIDVGLERKIPIIGEYKNGIMKIVCTEIELDYIRDVTEISDRRVFLDGELVAVLDKGDCHSYYSSPCYIKGQSLNLSRVSLVLSLLRKDPYILATYVREINDIVQDSTKGFQMVQSIPFQEIKAKKRNKKSRSQNIYKSKKSNSKKKVSRKLKKLERKKMEGR